MSIKIDIIPKTVPFIPTEIHLQPQPFIEAFQTAPSPGASPYPGTWTERPYCTCTATTVTIVIPEEE